MESGESIFSLASGLPRPATRTRPQLQPRCVAAARNPQDGRLSMTPRVPATHGVQPGRTVHNNNTDSVRIPCLVWPFPATVVALSGTRMNVICRNSLEKCRADLHANRSRTDKTSRYRGS